MHRMRYDRSALLSRVLLGAVLCSACQPPPTTPAEPVLDFDGWRTYRGDVGATAFSALSEVHAGNVHELTVAWTLRTGDAREGNRSAIQCNPIVVDGRMFVTSPQLKVLALDAASGERLWTFDPFEGAEGRGVNRGVAYWAEGDAARVFHVAGPFLYALDPSTGRPDQAFGDGGRVDLRKGLGRSYQDLAVTATTPGVVYGDLLIQGTALGEGYDAAPGHVRAYSVRDGRLVWTFHTIPQPGEFGYDTWPPDAWQDVGGVNSWGGLSLDPERGIVFLATGSPAFDFYGGNRAGANLFGNSIVALEAATGERLWHFQTTRHDLWDYDLPAAPALVTVNRNGRRVDAVAQVTKTGYVFVLDRLTGEPLFPIEDRPVPGSTVDGEVAYPTQPVPVRPPPFVRQGWSDTLVTDRSPEAARSVRAQIAEARTGPMYTPPSLVGTVQLPGTRGGAEWSGGAVDPATGWLYVNANELPNLITLVPVERPPTQEVALADLGREVYLLQTCATCHGSALEGQAAYPALADVGDRLTEAEIRARIRRGMGQMPPFPHLSDADVAALVAYLTGSEARTSIQEAGPRGARAAAHRYAHTGWNQLRDHEGYPGIKPPWGTLSAIDLNEGTIEWQVPLGTFPELAAQGYAPTGTQNLGGAIVTAGGLVFIGAAQDEKIRAFDKRTGEVLWEHALPAGGYATPATYEVDGRQFIVIAAGGGGKLGTPSGDAYVAFALPER